MKKLLIVAATAIVVGVTANAAQQIGVTEIKTSTTNTVIPVAYCSFTNTAIGASVKELVKTTGLSAGTWLLAYDNGFKSWQLQEDESGKKWVSAAIAEIAGVNPSAGPDAPLSKGSALWVVRPNAESTSIFVYGAYVADINSTIAAGTTALIANPKQTSATPSVSGMANGDVITIINGDELNTYSYNSTKGQWGSWVKSGKSLPTWTPYTFTAMSMGAGLWYRSTGSGAVTISWE